MRIFLYIWITASVLDVIGVVLCVACLQRYKEIKVVRYLTWVMASTGLRSVLTIIGVSLYASVLAAVQVPVYSILLAIGLFTQASCTWAFVLWMIGTLNGKRPKKKQED